MSVRKITQFRNPFDHRNSLSVLDYRNSVSVLIEELVSATYLWNQQLGDLNRLFQVGSEKKGRMAAEADRMKESVLMRWLATVESLGFESVVLELKTGSDVEPVPVSRYCGLHRSHFGDFSIAEWFGNLVVDGFGRNILDLLGVATPPTLTNMDAFLLCKREWDAKYDDHSSSPFNWALRRMQKLTLARIPLKTNGDFIFQDTLYEISGSQTTLSEEHKKLLVLQEADKERKEFEKLKRLYGTDASEEVKRNREPIAEDVRIAVWRRDNGCCVRCGSKERLEYDHIIPFSKGGSNTVRNIQLLCEQCNRTKSDNI